MTTRRVAERQAAQVLAPVHPMESPPLDAADMPSLYALVAEQSAVAMFLVAPDGRFVRANPAACELFGRNLGELLDCTLNDVSHPDDMGWSRRLLADALEREAPSYRICKRYLRPNGDVVVADVTVTPLSDDSANRLGFFASAVDDTERVLANERAAASEALLRTSVDTLLDPWVLMRAIRDHQGAIVDFEYVQANREACRLNGVSHDDLIGMRLLDLLPGHRDTLLAMYALVVDDGTPLALDDHPFDVDGTTRWFDNRAVKVGDHELSFTWRDVTDAHHLRSSLAHMASSDPLTGLNNRFGLAQAIERLGAGERRSGAGVTVLYIDLNGLTAINNIHGHPAGDQILRAVAERVSTAVRTTDIVARVGGDEFVVIAPGTDADGSVNLAAKICRQVSTPVRIGAQQLTPSVSVGTCTGDHNDEIDELIARADTALIRIKRDRRIALA